MREIIIKWTTEDVIIYARDCMETIITEDEAETILNAVLRHHDASIGINWDVLHAEIDLFQNNLTL
jgi:hypothetical protein